MESRRRVILYGQSIILGSVGASLQRYAGLEVIPLAAPLPTAEELAALAPDAILFDTTAQRPDAALVTLATGQDLLLIGISPTNAEAAVWSGRHVSVSSAKDLVDRILEVGGGGADA